MNGLEARPMAEDRPDFFRGTPISRRGVLKLAGAAGIAAVASRLPGLSHVEDASAASVPSEINLSGGGVLTVDSEYQSKFPSPEEKRTAVLENTANFLKKVGSSTLVKSTKEGGSKITFEDGSTPVMAPVYKSDMGFVWITRPDSSAEGGKKSFPTLGNVHLLNSLVEGDEAVYEFEMEGIYLGRSEHPHEYVDNTGQTVFSLLDVGYFGTYFGDPKQGNGTTRAVVPVFLGWRTGDINTSSIAAVGVRNPDKDNFVFPTPTQTTRGGSILDMLKGLDDNIGKAVMQLTVGGAATIPAEGYEQQFVKQGLPGEFYTKEYILSRAKGAKKVYDLLRMLTLTRAQQDRYSVSNNQMDEKPIPEIFPDIVPLEGESAYKAFFAELKKKLLPNVTGISEEDMKKMSYDDALALIINQDSFDPSVMGSFPRSAEAIISQTSESIFDHL